MIRYALKCAEGHSFESWFQSADAYDSLASKGLVSCAVCGGDDVSKAMMAPRVSTAEDGTTLPAPSSEPERPLSQGPAHPAEQMLRKMREHVEKNSTYVGGKFAQEARAMHLGEVDEKPIHGEANAEEAKALLDDGVPILPLPIVPPERSN